MKKTKENQNESIDFVSILHLAKRKTDEKMQEQQQDGKFYRTRYSPPKKVCREKKHLSENIQKFLKDTAAAEAKKGIKQDPKEAKVLAEPEEKSNDNTRKVRKLNKSAKKAKAGPPAAFETGEGEGDDYGYTSSEANALYEQYLEKVQHVQERKSFAPCRRQLPSETFTTINRVKAAIDRDLQKPGSSTRPSRSRTRKSDSANRSRSTSGAGTFKRMDASNTSKLPESPTAKGSDAKRRRSRSFSRTHIPPANTEIPSSSNDKKIRSSSCAGTSNSMDPSNTFKLPAAPIPKASKRRSRSLSRTHMPSANTELTSSSNDNSSAGTSNSMDPINAVKQPAAPIEKASKRRSRSCSRTRKPSENTKLTCSSNDNSCAGTSSSMDPIDTYKQTKSSPAKAYNRRSRSFSRTRKPSENTKLTSSSNVNSCAGTSIVMDPSNTVKQPAAPNEKAIKRTSRSSSRTRKLSENTEIPRSSNVNSCAGTSIVMDPSNTVKQSAAPIEKASKRRSRSFSRTRKPSENTKLTCSSNDNSCAGTSIVMDPSNTVKQPAAPNEKAIKRTSRSSSRTRKPSENTKLTSSSNDNSCAGTSNSMDPINAFKLPAVPITKASTRRSRSFSRPRKPSGNTELTSNSNDNSCAGTSNSMDPINTVKQTESSAKASKRRSRSFSRTRKPSANAKLSRIDNSGAGTSNSVDPSNKIKQPECPPVKALNPKRKSCFISKTRNKTAITKLSNGSTAKNKTANSEETKNAAEVKKPNSKGTNAKKPPPPRKPKKKGAVSELPSKQKGAVGELPPKDPPAASGSGSLPKKRKFPPEDVQKQAKLPPKKKGAVSELPSKQKGAVAELPPKDPPAASGSGSLPKKRKFPPEDDVQKQGRANNKRRRNASTAPAN